MATLDSVSVGRIPPIQRSTVQDYSRDLDGYSAPITWQRRLLPSETILVRLVMVDSTARGAVDNSFRTRGPAQSFTFTDDDATNYTVRYWQDSIDWRLEQGGRWSTEIVLLKVA